MRIVYCLILIIFFLNNIAPAKDVLFDNPIEFSTKNNCKFDEFCKKYIDDIEIEKFIKHELENDYVVVSLDECIDVALKNNFNIEIKNHDYKSSKYEYQNALSKFLPTLNTTAYIADYQGQILVGGVLNDKFHETALSFNLTAEHKLTEGGKQVFQAKAAKYFEKSKKHEFNFSKSNTVYLTSKYYYEMLLAKLEIEIYYRNLIERNAQLSYAVSLEKSGFGTLFDVIRSKNESAIAKARLLRALNDFKISQAKLANIMGIKVDTSMLPCEKEVVQIEYIDKSLTMEMLFDLAKTKREDMLAYKDLISYEKQVKNVYYTDFAPKPLINFQQQFQGTVNAGVRPNYIAAAFMTWAPGENVFMGTVTKIKAQKEKIKSKILDYQNKIRNIEQEIVSSYSTMQLTDRELPILKNRVDYSKKSIELAMARFNGGKGILLDVIEAQSTMIEAKVEYNSSIIKYNISQLDLLYQSGIIDKSDIQDKYNNN